MSSLRTRLEQLESSLAALDSEVLVGMAVPETAAPAPAAPAATLEARAAAGHGGKEIER
jgi:hypothetical protein